MPAPDAEEVLAATRQLLRDARALLDNSSPKPNAGSGVLGLYEALCRALESIDGERVRVLLDQIALQVERLNELAREVERIRRLREGFRAG